MLLCRLAGEEEQVGGFDLIYKAKPIKILFGKNNFSMLGCLNNRQQQLKKIAKAVALKFTHGEKKKEDSAAQQQSQQPQQRKAWGANNINSASKPSEVGVGTVKRIVNSV
jgi:tubulin polyglutamylase TTLL9